MSIEKYHHWVDKDGNHFIPVGLEGEALINNRILNKGTAFSIKEREELGLEGLVPHHVSTMEEQLDRVYEGFLQRSTPIAKHMHLRALQDRNETLFYAVVSNHVEEMIPIIYTPTVGLACEEFSHLYQKARGLYISPLNVDSMHEMAHHFPSKDIRIIVATDNQGILGLGDLGIGGMGIPVGKLSLYTLGAGIHPASCLPITLDVGTDNEDLLKDPIYLGLPQKRLKGEAYAAFIEKFVNNVKKLFPKAVLQWEDFSRQNAFTNLDTYRNTLSSFNDDIQGTGAVALAGIINAMKIKNQKLGDQKYAIYGAGAGGIGIARQIYAVLLKEGMDSKAALEKIFTLDSKGLVMNDRSGLKDYKKQFATDRAIIDNWKLKNSGIVSLQELLENEKISVLIGTSGQSGSFTEDIIKQMLKNSERPVIFPLSNPTSNCEARPDDIFRWTDAKAIVATGSPFEDVEYNGKKYRIGQGNNVFVFPGIGFTAIVGKLKTIGDDVFTTAAYALADTVSHSDLSMNTIYPEIFDLRKITIKVATECLKNIIKRQGPQPNGLPPGTETKSISINKVLQANSKDQKLDVKEEDLPNVIESLMWKPEYLPYRKI